MNSIIKISLIWRLLLVLVLCSPVKADLVSKDSLLVFEAGSKTVSGGSVIQRDGKLVIAGASMKSGFMQVIVARYLPSGQPDNSFGIGGRMTSEIPGMHAYANAVALDDTGNIIVGGTARAPKVSHFFTMRFLPNGILDTRSMSKGIQLNKVGGDDNDSAYAVAVQTDGKVIQVGNSLPGIISHPLLNISRMGGYVFASIRMLPNGNLDFGYGRFGIVLSSVGSVSEDHASAVALQHDGKIVITGYSHSRYAGDLTVVRYNKDGSRDKSFGDNGKMVSQLSEFASEGQSIAIQRDGRILIGGSQSKGRHYDNSEFLIARLMPSGQLDPDFGIRGVNRFLPGPAQRSITTLAIQSDGKIILAGCVRLTSVKWAIIVGRLLSDGRFDTSFADDGFTQIEISEGSSYPRSLNIENNGDILVSGGISYPSEASKEQGGSLFLMRLDSAGQVIARQRWKDESSFSSQGK